MFTIWKVDAYIDNLGAKKLFRIDDDKYALCLSYFFYRISYTYTYSSILGSVTKFPNHHTESLQLQLWQGKQYSSLQKKRIIVSKPKT